jgi:TPP-dependent pyruvate/acetoin dehydrogenase alpha subunit
MGTKGLGKAKVRVVGNASELAPHENPLVRNETLRQMYRKMVELRLLEEQVLRKSKSGARAESVRGEEACRVSLAQGLMAGDVVLDSRADGLMGHLFGVKLPEVMRDAKAAGASGGLLPFVEGAEARLFASMGAGLMLKSMQKKSVVVVYVRAREAAKGVWRQVLKVAGASDLPIIFVVLPRVAKSTGKGGSSGVCELAQQSGVPGIPVDVSDAVALYRVAQESMGRLRGDGGPVLIECIPYRLEGVKERAESDPIGQLRGFMLGRKVCTEAWMNGVEARFRERLKSLKS